jgi:hypothetical protein
LATASKTASAHWPARTPPKPSLIAAWEAGPGGQTAASTVCCSAPVGRGEGVLVNGMVEPAGTTGRLELVR